MKIFHFSTRDHSRGQALIPVLMVVLILTAFAVSLFSVARRENQTASEALKNQQAKFIAEGAVQYTMAQIQQVTNNGATPPQLTQPADTDSNGWTALGDGWYKVDIVDTTSRVNLNTVTANGLLQMTAFQGDPATVAAIIDWRDADDNPTTVQDATGAETDYYQSLSPPYECKNAAFSSVDELLLVKGMTPDRLYNLNSGAASPADNSATGGLATRQVGGGGGGNAAATLDSGQTNLPLSELLTTYSRDILAAPDGSALVDVKAASQEDLQKLFKDQGVTGQQGSQILATWMRQRQQATSLRDLMGKTDGQGQVVVAPWPRSVMQKVADFITVGGGQYLEAPVNINYASGSVLATIPGMTQDLLTLLSNNSQQSTPQYTKISDLFQGTTFSVAQLRILYGRVCVKSSTYMIRVRVRLPGSTKTYAAEGLIEISPQPPQATATAGAGAGGITGGSSGSNSTQNTPPQPKLLQWHTVGRMPGWSTWAPQPNYTTGGVTIGNR